jgi:hypothetical protein
VNRWKIAPHEADTALLKNGEFVARFESYADAVEVLNLLNKAEGMNDDAEML